MAKTDAQYWKEGHGATLLYVGIAAGPLAWGIDLGSSYALAQHICSTGHEYLHHVITAVCFLISIAGLWAAYAALRELPSEPDHEAGGPIGRSKFMALWGIGFSIAFAMIVIAGGVPRWVLPPCM